MVLKNKIEITDFLTAVKNAKGDVWLESEQGDKYNLKSPLSRYVAIGALLDEHGNELKLFCKNSSDEGLFYNFFEKHPDTL